MESTITHATVCLNAVNKGLLMDQHMSLSDPVSTNLLMHCGSVTRERREARNSHLGAIIWFTGLSGAGKSTLAHAVEEFLHVRGCRTYVLDGDNVRHGLCSDLGFSAQDRTENIRRVGEVAKLFAEAGTVVLTSFISPYCDDRRRVRQMVEPGRFLEIFCDSPLDVCESRDVKGLYKKARAGEIAGFTGISAPYEAPEQADLIVPTGSLALPECVDQVIALIAQHGICRFGEDQTLIQPVQGNDTTGVA
jgi:adenylylsulfate kinase